MLNFFDIIYVLDLYIRMDSVESNQVIRGRDKNKKVWTMEEDRALIECLQEIAIDPRYKQDSTWKNGYLIRVEELINQKLPLRGIKADPHIDSRWKTLKGKYYAIAEILNKSSITVVLLVFFFEYCI